MHFLQLCADLSKKSKSIKAKYRLYPSERPYHALSENSKSMSNSSADIWEENIKNVQTQQKFNKIHQFHQIVNSKS